jgi:diguanylate cyclase (GGDEF)-like protein
MALLTGALLATPATLGFDAAHSPRDVRALALIGALIAVLVLTRMALLFVERDQLDVARREAQQALKQIAYHDGLTQLANRRSLYDAIAEAIAAGGGGTALLFVDLDGFKAVNDQHGHMAGDAVLAEVAGRLRRAVRGEDLVARHGGDEFVVLLRGLSPDQAGELAVQAAERVRAVLAEPVDTPVAQFSITASIGIALHPRDGTSPDQLIRVADDRMYQSKRSARAA